MMTLKNNLDSCLKTNPPDNGFFNAFNKFKDDNLQKILNASEKTLKCKAFYVEVAKLFGEDDQTLAKKTSAVKQY